MPPKEACGIVGIASTRPVAFQLYFGLRALQHRGQESAGIATFQDKIQCVKGMGLVHEVFQDNPSDLPGACGIAHVRYSTTGSSKIENSQPVVASSSTGDIALAHNGDIVNADAIRKELKKLGWAFITTTDSEVLIRLLANELASLDDIPRAVRNLMRRIVGSYSMVVLIRDRVIAIRDPLGIKPLCLGRLPDGNGYIAASETVALDVIGAEFERDVEPGEMVELTSRETRSHRILGGRRPAHCMFEWVYFARPDSVLAGRYVYDVRRCIGKRIAQEHPVKADVIVPVPDSGRTHAQGYSEETGIPYEEGLIKNRYIGRTFILPTKEAREMNVQLKLNAVRSRIQGKRVVLVDDSIVRGTTTRKIVDTLRRAGATQVHVRIGSPPIIAPCYLGIDMKTRDQFVALNRTSPEIAAEIGADSVGYLSMDGLVECIGLGRNDLCLGCLTGEYPVEVPGEKARFQVKLDSY
ncbi:MAG: amidophosphoribosyltransferase [Euryarchaeota archaeon]|nr:amidophosphoribosyltransferase [Euryarchaeota archaeon]